MPFIRPATPGFLVTLTATILLAIVSFSVPYIKSVYFLKASLTQENINGTITFGTLGYCLELSNGTTCSKPSIGYQLDINGLVGNDLPFKIPNVLVKWITYALFLHFIALILAAGSAVFGLLAHVREVSMACCSTCVSGFAAVVAMIAFIFDIALFFITKSRVNAISGASASIGIGIWLTLAAWLLLFFAGCFFGLGRCCVRRRPRADRREGPKIDNDYTEQMRLDAVKAEADRKARQKQGEIGLPAFREYEQTQPLTKPDPEEYLEDGDQILPYHNGQRMPSTPGAGVGAGTASYARQGASPPAHAGYTQAPAGSRAVDDYYNGPSQTNTYPPAGHTQVPSAYAPSAYSYSSSTPSPAAVAPTAGAAAATIAGSQLLAPGAQYSHSQYPTTATQNYGHAAGGTSYHSAASHQQYPSNYSTTQYPDPYSSQVQTEPAYNVDTYNTTGFMNVPTSSSPSHPSGGNTYFAQSSYQPAQSQPERSYTLGGGGYGANAIPDHSYQTQGSQPPAQPQPDRSYTLGGGGYAPSSVPEYTSQADYNNEYQAYYPTRSPSIPSPHSPSPAPINATVSAFAAPSQSSTSPRGPRPPSGSALNPPYEDSPPMYDAATAQPPGAWGAKH